MAALPKRVVEFGLTRDETEDAVNAQRAAGGKPKVKRGRPLASTRGNLREVVNSGETESLDRLATDFVKLPPGERTKVRDEVDKGLAALAMVRKQLG